MVSTKPTQKQQILDLLRQRGQQGLTALEALDIARTMRLAAYVKFLKDDGHNITTEIIEVPGRKHVALYRLIEDKPAKEPAPPGLLFSLAGDGAKL